MTLSEHIDQISGTVAPRPPAGSVCKGEIISITSGSADEFMTQEQCEARKTPGDTAFIEVEIGIEEYGVITTTTFRNYGVDGAVISPNTMHGRILATYNDLKVGDNVNMIANEKTLNGGNIIQWKVVTV